MTHAPPPDLAGLLAARYADAPTDVAPDLDTQTLRDMAGRGSCRHFEARPVPPRTLEVLCAVALAAPSKSDLQQRDIVLLHSAAQRRALCDLVPTQGWIADAPMIAVFCGNNRRQRLVHEWAGLPFANDHLDAFFNASVDAGIALGAFVTAAEAAGLGCCPISAVRNAPEAVSTLLELPDHVFPVAGLAIGFPAAQAPISKRLPLGMTCHPNRYSETDVRSQVAAYDQARAQDGSYPTQRLSAQFGRADSYGWSDDKARQYSQPERADFGAFVRARGFRLD